jgi:ABC-type cobalamin/Fe3+-siderophores transport system ATPase subunit
VNKAVIVIGLSGVGKSTLLNVLHSGNPNGKLFKAADSSELPFKYKRKNLLFTDVILSSSHSMMFHECLMDKLTLVFGEQTLSGGSKDSK